MAEPTEKQFAWYFTVTVFVLGALVGVGATASFKLYASPKEKPCAQVYDQENHLKNVDQEIFDTRNKVINDLVQRNQQLEAEIKQARANPTVQMLAQTGHVMNEQQCRAWMSTAVPAQ